MRKSGFLLNLIAATTIGLSAVGCDSSSSGGIADTTDLSAINNNNNAGERRNLREYLLVGQRGMNDGGTPVFGAGQSAPAETGGRQVATAPGDAATVPGQLFELLGISSTPNPNAIPVAPGTTDEGTGNEPGDLAAEGTTGYQEMVPSPNGDFAIGISRARNLAAPAAAFMQIYALRIEAPLDEVFPPNIIFDNVADNVPVRFFNPNQGEFVSGIWSSDGKQFYVSIENSIFVYGIDGTIGQISDDPLQILDFPLSVTGVTNNAARMISARNGGTVYALDNANGNILTYSRNVADGFLTLTAVTPTVSDPRGFTLDRSGNFMYVVGRTSGAMAGYQVADDGTLTPFDLFPEIGLGPIPFPFGVDLGDVAANPQGDNLFLAEYDNGLIQAYTINAQTGALVVSGGAEGMLNGDGNIGNIEVEPTGRFVVSAHEHTFESLEDSADTDLVFANIDSGSNGAGGSAFSATPQTDADGNVVYVLPDQDNNGGPIFTGSVQISRILPPGGVDGLRAEERVEAENPFGLNFFQKVLQVPGGDGTTPIQP